MGKPEYDEYQLRLQEIMEGSKGFAWCVEPKGQARGHYRECIGVVWAPSSLGFSFLPREHVQLYKPVWDYLAKAGARENDRETGPEAKSNSRYRNGSESYWPLKMPTNSYSDWQTWIALQLLVFRRPITIWNLSWVHSSKYFPQLYSYESWSSWSSPREVHSRGWDVTSNVFAIIKLLDCRGAPTIVFMAWSAKKERRKAKMRVMRISSERILFSCNKSFYVEFIGKFSLRVNIVSGVSKWKVSQKASRFLCNLNEEISESIYVSSLHREKKFNLIKEISLISQPMRHLFAANEKIYLTQWYLLIEWPRSL